MRNSRIIAILSIIMLLSLASCRSNDTFSKKLPHGETSLEETSSETTATTEETEISEPSEPTETEPEVLEKDIEEVTELATYELKNKCTIDSVGVVRVFDDEGKKKVFRPFCDGDSVVTFSCVEGVARPTSKACSTGCWISTTRGIGECREKTLPPHIPKPVPTPD